MMILVPGFILLLSAGFKLCVGDYACLCNYAVETPIHSAIDDSSSVIGYMREFQCSPEYTQIPVTTPGWYAVADKHHVGYVQQTGNIARQSCQGNPSPIHTVPNITTTTPAMTMSTTTTTTQLPTVQNITLAPSTTTKTTTKVTTTKVPTTMKVTKPLVTTKQTTTTKATTSLSTTSTTTKATTTTSPTKKATTTTSTTTKATTTTSPTTKATTTTSTTTKATTTTSTTTKATTTPTTTTSSPIVTHSPVSVWHPLGLHFCPSNVITAARHNHGYYRVHAGSCYELVPHKHTWRYAENDCKNKGGHLVHISNRDEDDFILQFLDSHDYYHAVWTGLNDLNHEEHFYWTSGDRFGWSNWIPWRKSNYINHHYEDCVLYVPYAHYAHWDDIDCERTYSWICRYDPVSGYQTTTHSTFYNIIQSIAGRDVSEKK